MSLPTAQPAYILRGHAAQIHSTSFIRSNGKLVTGDADGWIVIWSLATKRPVAVWQAHEGAILGARTWGPDNLITHGKDNKLIVWKLAEEDEVSMSKVLPVDTPPEPRKQPWLLHILHVDIFHLPSSQRIHTVPGDKSIKGGMIMALALFHHPQTTHLTIIAGYESGHTTVSQFSSNNWSVIYTSQVHTQPILSLDVSPLKDAYLTSSADAIIAKHPIPVTPENIIMAVQNLPLKTVQTKHSGQQGLRVRNDGKIFATAGWDTKVRVYSTKSMKELAVLKWHKEGCFAVAFADVVEQETREGDEKAVVKTIGTINVKDERLWKAKNAHWLAVGSKDGKVSLWDIY